MIKFLFTSALSVSVLSLAACSGGTTTAENNAPKVEKAIKSTATLADIIAHPRRAEETARDQYRNPKETLEFFEVGPGKKVAEIWPGWYTNVIAPYLKENDGQYVAVLYPEGIGERLDKRIAGYKEKYSDTSVYLSLIHI